MTLAQMAQALRTALAYLNGLRTTSVPAPVNNPVPAPIATPIPDHTVAPHTPTKLDQFCTAIRDYEGGPGDRNYRNNNPGNCRYSQKGYAAIYGRVGRDKDGFAIFPNYATGWLYLENLVKGRVYNLPIQTIAQFFTIYAPSSDNNNPSAYANYVARQCGVPVEAPISTLLAQ